jgi:hypothetical protein
MKGALVLIFSSMIISVYAQTNSNEPLKNFDVLCEIFDKGYASFEEKGIDWKSRCKEYRLRVSANSSDPELFYIMTELLKPLNDAHVKLKAKKLDSSFSATRESRIMKEFQSILREERKPMLSAMTENTLTKNDFEPIKELGPKFRDKKLFSYTKSANIGYLRFFRSFGKILLMNGPSVNKHLTSIFNSFEDLDAVIVDVRFNIGGEDRFSQNVAGRFIEKETVGFMKQTRKDGIFGGMETRMIKPKGKKAFLNKVVLLTNDRTVSAADVLALMMNEFPNVTIIGERSNGSYSDLNSKILPNGWKLTLSNQRYFSASNKNYEGYGTPVDIEVKDTFENIQKKEDAVLLRALEFLSK